MALKGPEDPVRDSLIQKCISFITTEGVLEGAYAESEAVRAEVQRVIEGYKPALKGGENIPADHPDAGAAGAIALAKQASHARHSGKPGI